ncbi:hypothetical protein GCM10028807_37260 [Spirosoma daeguense]
MENQTLAQRATMPAAHNPVLERRTVANANQNLLKYLQPGLSVLDMGCGSGAITRNISEIVGPTGRVLGIDPNAGLIEQARQNTGATLGLSFEQGDVYTFDTLERFDLITCARTLQWLREPQKAILNMKRLLKPGGWLSILDYNHEKISWTPEPPVSMHLFYNAFLQWRKDAGFDNAIADQLSDLMQQLGLENVRVETQHEISLRHDATFATSSRLWSEVAELRGPQLVKDGYVTESQRIQAIADYDQWIANSGESMTVYLLAVEGQQAN